MWVSMVYGVLMWTVTVYAFRRGGWMERIAAAGTMIGSYLSAVVVSPDDDMFRHVEVKMALVDFGLFMLLWCNALSSKRFWPLWLASIQGVVVLAHAAPLIPNMSPFAADRAVALWSWPQWIILAFGVRNYHRAKAAAMS